MEPLQVRDSLTCPPVKPAVHDYSSRLQPVIALLPDEAVTPTLQSIVPRPTPQQSTPAHLPPIPPGPGVAVLRAICHKAPLLLKALPYGHIR